MILRVVVVGPYQENTYIIGSDETQEAAIVDAGAEWRSIMSAVEDSGLKVKYLLTTHGHEDHIGAVADMVDATNAPFAIHENDVYMLEKPPDSASIIPGFRNPPEPDLYLKEGDTVEIGDLSFSVIENSRAYPWGDFVLRSRVGLHRGYTVQGQRRSDGLRRGKLGAAHREHQDQAVDPPPGHSGPSRPRASLERRGRGGVEPILEIDAAETGPLHNRRSRENGNPGASIRDWKICSESSKQSHDRSYPKLSGTGETEWNLA